MTIYRIATPPVTDGEGQNIVYVAWASSARTARGEKATLAELASCKSSEVTVEEVDVRKGKAGIIEYLNGFHGEVPAGYKPKGYTTPGKVKKVKKAKKKVAKKK